MDPNVFGNPSQNMSIYSLLQMRETARWRAGPQNF